MSFQKGHGLAHCPVFGVSTSQIGRSDDASDRCLDGSFASSFYVHADLGTAVSQGDKHAARFTVYDFYAFNEKLKKDGMSPKTVADRMMIVRQLLKCAPDKAKPQKLLPLNPIAAEPLQKKASKPRPCFPTPFLTINGRYLAQKGKMSTRAIDKAGSSRR